MSAIINLFRKSHKIPIQSQSPVKIKPKDSFKSIEGLDDNYLTKNKVFCCPKCKQKAILTLNPKNFTVSYDCQNNHNQSNINYITFYNDKNYVKYQSDIICQQCKIEKLNYNNYLCCNNCHFKLCNNCIIKHKYIYSHNNYRIVDNSTNKCSKHDVDISHYCKKCKENLCVFCLKKSENKSGHSSHEEDILNFSDLIVDTEVIENNKNKLQKKIEKNKMIIEKLNKWIKEMNSLIKEIINNLNSEIMINKIIVENFNWKYLDYINYTNYKNAIDKIELSNEKLDDFLNSKMFIEQTTTLTNYLFNKNIPINDIDRKNNNKKNIFSIINNNNFHEEEKDDIFINNINNDIYNINNNDNEEITYINILDILINGNAVLCNKNNIYTYYSDRNELKKIEEEKNDKNISLYSNDNDNGIDKNNKKICKSLFNLQKNISLKIDDYNILIWKMEKEKELKKEKLFNFINNYENNDVINKPKENLLSEENKVENKEQEKEKEDKHDKQNEIKNIEDKNLIQNNEIKEEEKEKENNINSNIFNPFSNIFSNNFNNSKENNKNENIEIKEEEKKKEEKDNNKSNNLFSSSLFNNNNNENNENSERVNLAISNSNNDTENNHDTSFLFLISNNNNNNTNINNTISLFTNNNRAGVSLFDQTNDYTYNNLFSNSINYNREVQKEEREREIEYVYISATGHKYHGRSQCGRMKSSRRVPITTAEAMGLDPCMKCY